MTQKSSPSDMDCVSDNFKSGAFGYTFLPIGVLPLPSLPWQVAQWSAKWARAFFNTSGENGTGLVVFRCSSGIARRRICRAIMSSNACGSVLALKPVVYNWYPTQPNAPRAATKIMTTAPISFAFIEGYTLYKVSPPIATFDGSALHL